MDGYRTTHHPRLPFIRIWGAYCLIHQCGAIHLNASQVQTNSSHRVQSPEKNSSSAVDGSLAGWERTAVSHPKGIRLWDEAPWADIRSPRIPQRDRAVCHSAYWMRLLWSKCHFTPHSCLCISPSILALGEVAMVSWLHLLFGWTWKKKPVCPFMFTYFLVSQWQLVCWGVLGSDAGSSVLHPLESSCVVNLSLKWLYWAMRHLRVRA